MPRLSGGAGAQSALAQAAGGVPPRSTSSGQLPESQVAPCGAASAVARPYGVPESGQTSHNGGVLVRRGFRNRNGNSHESGCRLGQFPSGRRSDRGSSTGGCKRVIVTNRQVRRISATAHLDQRKVVL